MQAYSMFSEWFDRYNKPIETFCDPLYPNLIVLDDDWFEFLKENNIEHMEDTEQEAFLIECGGIWYAMDIFDEVIDVNTFRIL